MEVAMEDLFLGLGDATGEIYVSRHIELHLGYQEEPLVKINMFIISVAPSCAVILRT